MYWRSIHSAGVRYSFFFILIMYLLIKQNWLQYITGVKIKKDERNFYTVNEGTRYFGLDG